MKDKVIFFILGGAVGSVAAYLVTKKTYEKKLNTEVDQRVNSEIAAYKEYEKKKKEAEEKPERELTPEEKAAFVEKPDLMEFCKQKAEEHQYVNYSDSEDEKIGPVIVSEDEIPMGIEDEIVRYRYYQDDILVDSDDDVLTDREIRNTCGFAALDAFGRDENPDLVYVFNSERNRYYEITLDSRTYEEAQQ